MKLRSTGEPGVTAGCDERAQAPAPAADPRAVVIFGATGDLAMRKLVPGYETLLYDCSTGDATRFHRADIVEAGWELVAPVMAAWQAGGPPVRNYAAGSWGPPEADALTPGATRLRNATTSPPRLPRKVRSPCFN